MQNTNYNTKKIVEWLKLNSFNDSKKKGSQPTTPKDDGITSDIKSVSITQDIDGTVFGVSFHDSPTKFYSFVLPEELYDKFLWFQRNYKYTRTPKKKILNKNKFDGLFEEEKSPADLLKFLEE